MGKVIAVMNQKGGVGKTTTTVNLGAALSEKSFKILLVDLDPAGNMSQWLDGSDHDEKTGVSDLLENRMNYADIVRNSDRLGVDYIGSGERLRNTVTGDFDLETLRRKFAEIKGNYDFILFDCPPSSDPLIGGALLASDSIIIPIQTETLPLQAGIRFLDWLDDFSGHNGGTVNIMGVLPCMFDSRTRLSKDILRAMRSSENLGPLVFDTVIRKNVRLAELSGSDRSIFKSASTSFGASDYAELASEVIRRSGVGIGADAERSSTQAVELSGVDSSGSETGSAQSEDTELVYQESGSDKYETSESKEDS
jgi:chromosome partitioning protein